ncbi:MAG TPA: DUF2752 domain-containing protein [Flavobacteriaceae bacterium]|nr:DUF2752 domain-containing protein [Flavobacteriaceae bacterium]
MEKYMLTCPTKKYLGFDCLGCGLQRSVFLLLKGEFVEAFYMYPAIYPMLLLGFTIAFHQFFPLKHIVKIVWVVGILTAATMVGSYVLKHFV